MITHVYICNRCDGDITERTFEQQYVSLKKAEEAPIPPCPRCSSAQYVTRFFGHKVFARRKPCRMEPAPGRFVPLRPQHHKGLLSIGIRATEEIREEVEKHIEELVEENEITLVQSEAHDDVPEEVFGLKKGSIERALFDLRHERMIQELEEGKPISGFYMPLSGEYSN